jgi:hypothetical protein
MQVLLKHMDDDFPTDEDFPGGLPDCPHNPTEGGLRKSPRKRLGRKCHPGIPAEI